MADQLLSPTLSSASVARGATNITELSRNITNG
jgi:hypothetical protein